MSEPMDIAQEMQALADVMADLAMTKQKYQSALEQILEQVLLTPQGITNLDTTVIPKVRRIAEEAFGPRCERCGYYRHQHGLAFKFGKSIPVGCTYTPPTPPKESR